MAYSLYIHIPFCRQRCTYCDFNTYAGQDELIPAYVTALCQEAAWVAATAGERPTIQTIFLGGGTPSVLPLGELERLFKALDEHWIWPRGLEATLEANPGTLSLDYLRGLRALGLNRLSLGVQSAHPDELRGLGRIHTYPEVIEAVKWARQAGFDNLNLDLIFGLPGQPLASWERTLELATGLRPEHFSLYALTLEPGTPMQAWVGRGLLPEPEADLAADMYEYAMERLEQAGYGQYEISNWALADGTGGYRACRHNLQYWRNLPYIGLGAGAHGYAGGLRVANVLAPATYIQRLKEPPTAGSLAFPRTPATGEALVISRADEIAETMMMGLRLTREGVGAGAFAERFGLSLAEHFGPQIERLREQGLLEWASDRLRLTERGRLLGNRVFVEFV
jgi:oxygen-independent coproporphyrinogen-3 oxidase